jgi:putative FmdB family regulatory protein
MPVYAYHCNECEADFEAKQSFSDDPITDCPVCDTKGSVIRVIQPAGVVFKGSGWYVTDSRGSRKNLTSSGPGNSDKSNGSDDTGDGAKSSTEKPSTEKTNTSK